MGEPIDFTADKAKAALLSVLEAIESKENSFKLAEAKDAAGTDMLKVMQLIFPILLQIKMDIIKTYGFHEGREGIIHFSKLIRTLEKDDPEIAHLNAQVRSHFLPPVAITTETHQTQ